jgi:hypothetical protein
MTDQIEQTESRTWIGRMHGHLHSPGDSYQLLGWALGWAVAFVGASWFLRSDPAISAGATWIVAAAPNLLALGVVVVYLRFLRDADELVRRIQLEGLAFGFGVGVVFSMGYQLLEGAGAPNLSLSDLAGIMMFAFVVGVVRANRQYS